MKLFLLQFPQLVVAPICFISTWTLISIFIWSVYLAFREGLANLRRLHQIPCSRCIFFSGDYRLKCAVHPSKALTEEAINCLDYQLLTHTATVCPKRYQK